MNNIVVIGAGLSGRGYLNRLLYLSKKHIIFMDTNEQLIHQLQQEKKYEIAFGNDREPLRIDNFDAYVLNDVNSIDILSKADMIMICVGANHVSELWEPLQKSLVKRADKHVDIIVAENGIHPSSPLSKLKEDPRVHISEAVIFCTTLGKENTLDIFSENLDHLPYDVPALGHTLDIYGLVEEYKFPILLERKIYTYNCISACIAYLGYVKGYSDYAKAANDPFIDAKIHRIADVLNTSIATEYNMHIEEQIEFSKMAIAKFQNIHIVDTIDRNVRDVERKLASEERIVAPLKIIEKHKGFSDEMLDVCACAIVYGMDTHTLTCKTNCIEHYFSQLPNTWKARIKEKVEELKK